MPADDPEWSQAVAAAVMLPVQAWQVGVDSTNVDTYAGTDPSALRIVGTEAFEPTLGLVADYPRRILAQVGNYEEIYQRNLGDSGLILDGSPNDLLANGGLQTAPPLS
ncbi:MAG: hypothetical protein AAF567_00130 [Actinomycetota bacterium]